MGHGKVAIIGAGSVGSTVAYALLLRDIAAEILLVDISSDILQGQILDLTEATTGTSTVVRAGTFNEAGQANVIVVTAHAPRTSDLAESEWIKRNQHLMRSILFAMLPIAPHAVLIVGTEPVDLLTLQVQEKANLPRHRIFGVGRNTRKTGRARAWAAQMVNINNNNSSSSSNSNSNSSRGGLRDSTDVRLFVIGSEMIPVVAWYSASVDGKPMSAIPDLATNRAMLEHIVSTDRMSEIAKLKGGAWFGQAAMVARVVETVLNDGSGQKKGEEYHPQGEGRRSLASTPAPAPASTVYVLSTYVERFETCVAVPVFLTRDGVERQVPLDLSLDEEHALEQSANHTYRLYHDTIRDLDS